MSMLTGQLTIPMMDYKLTNRVLEIITNVISTSADKPF